MQIYISNQFTYLLASAAFGIVAGIIYNILNLILLFFVNPKKMQLFIDGIFCLIFFCLYGIISFSFNSGTYRWYSAVIAVATLYAFNRTIGVILVKLESTIVKLIKRVYRKLVKALDFLLKFVKITIVNYKIHRYKNELEYDLLHIPNQERKTHEQARYKSKKAKA